MVLWFPRFFLMEVVALLLVGGGLALLSLWVDAPLLAMADPTTTPDPSKAPWYFVGLQELLHYYPPVVAGALVPAAAIAALVALPYLGRPEVRAPLWPEGASSGGRRMRLGIALVVFLFGAVAPAAHVPWAIVVPTVLFGGAMLGAGRSRGPLGIWLADRSLRGWLMAWGCTLAVVLSVIGALFRGPGWSWTWPWLDGVF